MVTVLYIMYLNYYKYWKKMSRGDHLSITSHPFDHHYSESSALYFYHIIIVYILYNFVIGIYVLTCHQWCWDVWRPDECWSSDRLACPWLIGRLPEATGPVPWHRSMVPRRHLRTLLGRWVTCDMSMCPQSSLQNY